MNCEVPGQFARLKSCSRILHELQTRHTFTIKSRVQWVAVIKSRRYERMNDHFKISLTEKVFDNGNVSYLHKTWLYHFAIWLLKWRSQSKITPKFWAECWMLADQSQLISLIHSGLNSPSWELCRKCWLGHTDLVCGSTFSQYDIRKTQGRICLVNRNHFKP